jgi:aryl-alcohol dehydrogenase-like predicted oxidoreductase
MRALDDLVRAGKVLYVGISDTPAWVVAQANTIATLRGWSPFVALQIEYNLNERTVERELISMARGLGLSVLAWSPLAGGLLTGKYQQPGQAGDARFAGRAGGLSERTRAIVDAVRAVADEGGWTLAQVALAWLRTRPRVIPIVGARTPEQFSDNLRALECRLSGTQIQRLDAVSAVDLGFPHEFLIGDENRDIIFGGRYGELDQRAAYS